MARIGKLSRKDIDGIVTAARPRILARGGGSAGGVPGPQGPPGPKGVVWRGAWAADTDYNVGDIVTSATDPGTSPLTFFCIEANTSLPGAPPTVGGDTNWHEIDAGYLLTDGSRPYVLAPGHTPAEGCLAWDTAAGLDLLLMDVLGGAGLVRVPILSAYVQVLNSSGVNIGLGVPVRISAADELENLLTIERLSTSDALNDQSAPALTAQAIADGEKGWVCRRGYVAGPDLSLFGAGQQLYVFGTGGLSDAPPLKGCGARIKMGVVIVADNPGSIWVDPDWRPDLDELANVSIGDFATKQTFDVPMWLPDPSETGCDAWRDVPASRVPSVTVTTDYVATAKDVVVLVDSSAGPVDVELPQINVVNQGRMLRVKRIAGADVVTVSTAAAEMIDGDPTVSLLKIGEALDFQAEASDWVIL